MPSISDSRRGARIQAVREHFRMENTHGLDAVTSGKVAVKTLPSKPFSGI
jgi:hypothetical protein